MTAAKKKLRPKKEPSSKPDGKREGIHLYNFRVPVSLFYKIKAAAVEQERPINELLVEVLTDWLEPY